MRVLAGTRRDANRGVGLSVALNAEAVTKTVTINRFGYTRPGFRTLSTLCGLVTVAAFAMKSPFQAPTTYRASRMAPRVRGTAGPLSSL